MFGSIARTGSHSSSGGPGKQSSRLFGSKHLSVHRYILEAMHPGRKAADYVYLHPLVGVAGDILVPVFEIFPRHSWSKGHHQSPRHVACASCSLLKVWKSHERPSASVVDTVCSVCNPHCTNRAHLVHDVFKGYNSICQEWAC